MAFILASDGRDAAAFRRYHDYLTSMKHVFPPSAYALATSDWYGHFEDHRCPHDAWLEELSLKEPASGQRRSERMLSLRLRLLGAYHDGYIELFYPRVYSYRLNLDRGETGHRDWRYDELRLSENGHLIHEIEWWHFDPSPTGTWIIEASDLEHRWIPLDAPPS